MARVPRFSRTRRYGTSDQHRRNDRKVRVPQDYDALYEKERSASTARKRAIIDPIEQELDREHDNKVSQYRGIRPNYWVSPFLWWSSQRPVVDEVQEDESQTQREDRDAHTDIPEPPVFKLPRRPLQRNYAPRPVTTLIDRDEYRSRSRGSRSGRGRVRLIG